MTTVRFLGWSPGLNKVELTKLVRDAAGVALNEAHNDVNRLLSGEVVEIRLVSQRDAQRLAETAAALGVQTEYVSIPESSTATSR